MRLQAAANHQQLTGYLSAASTTASLTSQHEASPEGVSMGHVTRSCSALFLVCFLLQGLLGDCTRHGGGSLAVPGRGVAASSWFASRQ